MDETARERGQQTRKQRQRTYIKSNTKYQGRGSAAGPPQGEEKTRHRPQQETERQTGVERQKDNIRDPTIDTKWNRHRHRRAIQEPRQSEHQRSAPAR